MVYPTQHDIDKAIGFAFYLHGGDNGGHGIGHIRRVMKNARFIMKSITGDFSEKLILFCCALHDVDDKKVNKSGLSRLDAFLSKRLRRGINSNCKKYYLVRIVQRKPRRRE